MTHSKKLKIIVDRKYLIGLIKSINSSYNSINYLTKLTDDILFIDDDEKYIIDENEHDLIVELLHFINILEKIEKINNSDLAKLLDFLENKSKNECLNQILNLKRKYEAKRFGPST